MVGCRVTYLPDTKVANAATFEIQREDHTVGDPLVMQLHEDHAVAFAAYKIPHPLEHRLLIKVKTTSAASTPAEVYNGAIDTLKAEVRCEIVTIVVSNCGHARRAKGCVRAIHSCQMFDIFCSRLERFWVRHARLRRAKLTH